MTLNTNLEIHYDEETDTLSVWNGRPVYSSYEVQQHLLIELDANRTPVGFTLEHALELLQAHLPGNSKLTESNTTGATTGRRTNSAAKELPQSVFPEKKPRN